MILFQGADVFYWFWVAVAFTILTAVVTWYWVVVGRDRPPRKLRRGESTVTKYGPLEEDHAPLPKLMIWTIVGVVVWAVFYVGWTGVQGMGW